MVARILNAKSKRNNIWAATARRDNGAVDPTKCAMEITQTSACWAEHPGSVVPIHTPPLLALLLFSVCCFPFGFLASSFFCRCISQFPCRQAWTCCADQHHPYLYAKRRSSVKKTTRGDYDFGYGTWFYERNGVKSCEIARN